MVVTVLVSFLMGLCCFHGIVHCGVIERRSAEVPFRSRCSRTCETPQEEPNEQNFPLYQCSCSRSCSVYGDCCFDSKHKNATVWRKIDFVCLSLIDRGKYRAVFGCPSDKPADFCIDGLGHLPPVTSRTTNITYANFFCATCNGDSENLVKWNVELSCSSDEEESSSNGTTRIIWHGGDIWRLNEEDGSKSLCMYRAHFEDFSFLRGLELRSCARIRKIAECSASWRDLPTIQLCRSYEDPVYFHDAMYQNLHCAKCNYLNPVFADCMPFQVRITLQMGIIDSKVDNFCEDRGTDTCILILTSKGRLHPFSDLLNIQEKMCLPPAGRRCCKGEAFDFRTGRCRKTKRG